MSSFVNFLQQVTGPDGKKIELESNVLHANFENAQYPITVDVLHTVRICLSEPLFFKFILSSFSVYNYLLE